MRPNEHSSGTVFQINQSKEPRTLVKFHLISLGKHKRHILATSFILQPFRGGQSTKLHYLSQNIDTHGQIIFQYK